MARAAWVQVILTLTGVLLIWRTLVYTRVAAKAAEATVAEAKASTQAALQAAAAAAQANHLQWQAFVADQRPWVSVTYEAVDKFGWDGYGFRLALKFTLENLGKTPAKGVALGVRAFPSGRGVTVLREQETLPLERHLPENFTGMVLLPGGVLHEEWSETIDLDEAKDKSGLSQR